jgi:hypothetical protein
MPLLRLRRSDDPPLYVRPGSFRLLFAIRLLMTFRTDARGDGFRNCYRVTEDFLPHAFRVGILRLHQERSTRDVLPPDEDRTFVPHWFGYPARCGR